MKLKRTKQCAKCPWRKSTSPHEIPDGYSIDKHCALAQTIADPGDISRVGKPLRIMACHETGDAHCIGWLSNQLGDGNNIPLRISMRKCENLCEIKLVGAQHKTFEETLPKDKK